MKPRATPRHLSNIGRCCNPQATERSYFMFKRHTIAAATLGVSMTIVGIAFAQQPTPAPAQPPARDGTATDHRA
jgi:hypothetical protein